MYKSGEGVDAFYVYPRRRHNTQGPDGQPLPSEIVLGSTLLETYNTQVNEDVSRAIRTGNERVLGPIADADVLREYVGLRPCRRGGVRVEAEVVDGTLIVHDYGHGGSGITLAFGTATEAIEIAERELNN